MEQKPVSAVAVGIIISLVLILISLIVYFTGMFTETWNQYLGFAVFVGGIVLAVRRHGRDHAYGLGFGRLFAFGFKVTAVIICLMILYTLFSGWLFPDIKDKLMAVAREQAMAEAAGQPGVNQAQVEAGMAMFEKNFTLFIVMGILFWYLFLGALSSLAGAALTRRRPPMDAEQI